MRFEVNFIVIRCVELGEDSAIVVTAALYLRWRDLKLVVLSLFRRSPFPLSEGSLTLRLAFSSFHCTNFEVTFLAAIIKGAWIPFDRDELSGKDFLSFITYWRRRLIWAKSHRERILLLLPLWSRVHWWRRVVFILTKVQLGALWGAFIILDSRGRFQLLTLALNGAENELLCIGKIFCITEFFDTLTDRWNRATHTCLVSWNILVWWLWATYNSAMAKFTVVSLVIIGLHDGVTWFTGVILFLCRLSWSFYWLHKFLVFLRFLFQNWLFLSTFCFFLELWTTWLALRIWLILFTSPALWSFILCIDQISWNEFVLFFLTMTFVHCLVIL